MKRDSRIHKIYRQAILDIVREHRIISRTEIYKLTDIRMATITAVTSELIAEGYLEEIRKPNKIKMLSLKSGAFYALGIDIQPENMIIILFDNKYNAIEKTACRIVPDMMPDEALNILHDCVKVLLNAHGDKRLIGIGISVTGMVDVTRSTLISSSQLASWRNVPLKNMFSERYNVPVYVEDSALTNLIAEKACTNIREYKDIIYVQLGYGIGTGIMSKGQLVLGYQGLAGELGHSVIIPDGKLCTCGNYGCLRTVAASAEIIARYIEITRLCNGDASGIDIHTILKYAEDNQKIAMNVIDESVRYIGIALANSINMLNPRMIIFGGQMFEKSDYLLEPLRNVINRYILPQFTPEICYKTAELIHDGGATGAAVMVFDSFYSGI